MSKHTKMKGLLALATVVPSLLLTSGAWASPSQNVSFTASNDGASAGWTNGKGSPIELTLGSSPGSYAIVVLHHVPSTPVADLTEPTFNTDNYAAGSPRYYLTLSDGNTLWGYPSNSGLNGSDFAWAIDNGNTYQSWSAIQSEEGTTSVTGAWVIADADQSPGTVDTITALTFGEHSYN